VVRAFLCVLFRGVSGCYRFLGSHPVSPPSFCCYYLLITGKSTQVPQFILDANPTCSIVVTQPRRISAISIAERVAEEQCQDSGAGGLIGYQVRLESAMSQNTQLLFLTPGVLLRKMLSSPHLNQYSHIIIDEIHERDKYQEFLLVVLRDLLPARPDLHVVLMSATLQTVTLVDYFTSHGIAPAIVEMEGRMFPVQEFFLEQVLEMTGYVDASTGYDGGARFEEELAKLTGRSLSDNNPQRDGSTGQKSKVVNDVSIQCAMCGKRGFADAIELGAHIALCDGMLDSDDDVDDNRNESDEEQIADIGLSQFDDYDVDGKLGLEDYAAFGKQRFNPDVEKEDTESVEPETRNGSTAADEPEREKWDGISPFDLLTPGTDGPTEEVDVLLNQYQAMHDDETIDSFLLLEVVQYIVKSSYGDGGILVFFPGWQEISEFSLMLESTSPFRDRSKYLILPLHSGIPSRDQRRVLQRPPKGVRKIVLSTNIAETRSGLFRQKKCVVDYLV